MGSGGGTGQGSNQKPSSMEVEEEDRRYEGEARGRGREECRISNVGNEEQEKVEQTGLKKVTREAEGMGLLQWQRKWGGSPDRVRYGDE